MDGVIVDSAPLHFEAWRETFRSRGWAIEREEFDHTFGLRNDAIIRSVLGEGVEPGEIANLSREKEEDFRRRLGQSTSTLPGVRELMESAARLGFRQAMASSAPRLNIEVILRTLDTVGAFDAIVAGEDVVRGKPDPEVFLAAAERLGIDPGRCIVIEDAVGGVQGAGAAGMKCVAVTNTHPRGALARADLVVDSLEEVDPEILEGLIPG